MTIRSFLALLVLIAGLPVQANDAASAVFDLKKSMIPLIYAATTMASLCQKRAGDESDRVKKQRVANERIVQGLTARQKVEYQDEVRRVQAQIKAEFDALTTKGRERECAGLQ